MEYTLSKEFFGGIIHDKKRKNNLVVEAEEFSLLNIINLKNKNYNTDIQNILKSDNSVEYILKTLRELAEFNLILPNVEYKTESSASGNYLSSPLRLFYDITYLCNLKCKHYFTNSGMKNPEELLLEEKLKLVDNIKHLGISRVSIAGGEPFACKDLFPFVEKCKENDIGVSISTNGTFFSETVIEKINDLGIKTLTISFDGGTEESMDEVRGAGTYRKVIKNLNNLKKYYKGKYSLKTTLMKNNINNLEEVVKTGIEFGCSSVKFNTVREDGRAVQNKCSIVLNQQEYINTMKTLENLKKKYKNQIKIKAPLNVFCEDEYNYMEELGFGCFAGKESICVDALGNVRPCSHFPKEFICGNIRNDSLYNIWHKSEVLSKFRNFSGNDSCRSCKKYSMCRGGCRYRAFLSGDINGVDSYCYELKNRN